MHDVLKTPGHTTSLRMGKVAAAAAFGLLALTGVAHAHLGHLGELGGHSHWSGAAVLVGAVVLAGIGALKGRKKAKGETKETGKAGTPEGAEPEAA